MVDTGLQLRYQLISEALVGQLRCASKMVADTKSAVQVLLKRLDRTVVGSKAHMDLTMSLCRMLPLRRDTKNSEWKQLIKVVLHQLGSWGASIRKLVQRVDSLKNLELVVRHYDSKIEGMRSHREDRRMRRIASFGNDEPRLRDSGILQDMLDQVESTGVRNDPSGLTDAEVAVWMRSLSDKRLIRNQKKLQKARRLYESAQKVLVQQVWEICEEVKEGKETWNNTTGAMETKQNP